MKDLTDTHKRVIKQYIGAFDTFTSLGDVVKAYNTHIYLEEFLEQHGLASVSSDRQSVLDLDGNVHSLDLTDLPTR